MAVWWITLFITYMFCLFARGTSKITVLVDGEKIKKPNKIFSFFALLILVLVSGLRSGIGDTSTYRWSFELIPYGFFDYAKQIILNNTSDGGFSILGAFIKNFISDDSQVYFFILSAITLTLIFQTFYKYCGLLEVGVFTFITNGAYLVTMNGVRQYLVSSILFASFPLIYKKKFVVYVLLVLLMSTMHASALVFIPLYFLVNLPAWGKGSKILFIGGIISYIFYPITSQVFMLFLSDTQYSHYGDSLLGGDAGSNIIRMFVAVVPIVLSYIFREKIRVREKYFNIMLNFSILNFIFMMLSSASSWIFARFCMYFGLYGIILLCWCIKYGWGDKKNKGLIYMIGLTLYALYYYYEMHISLGQTYASEYITIFS